MGWFRERKADETTLWHDGVFSTFFGDAVIKPERGLGVVFSLCGWGSIAGRHRRPTMRNGVLAIAAGEAPRATGASVVAIGAWTGIATALLGIAAVMDLGRSRGCAEG